MRRTSLCILGIISFLAIGVVGTAWSATVPFIDGFEDYLGLNPSGLISNPSSWSADLGVNPSSWVEVFPDGGIDDSKYCKVNAADLTLTIDETSNVWVQIYTKLTPMSGPPTVPAGVRAAFYVDTDSNVIASDGLAGNPSSVNWTNLGELDLDINSSSADSTWLRFAAHLDDPNSNWDLYLSAEQIDPSKSGWDLLYRIGEGLGMMPGSGSGMTELIVSATGETEVSIDEVVIGKDWNTVDGSESNLQVIAHSLTAGTVKQLGFPHGYAAAQSFLHTDYRAGRDLWHWTEVSDVLTFVDPGNLEYVRLPNIGSPWDEPSVVQVVAQTGFWLSPFSSRPYVAFCDYDKLFPATGPAAGPPTVLHSKGDGNGYNQLANNSGKDALVSDGLGFVGKAGNGDRLYIITTAGQFKMLYWFDGQWYDSGSPVGANVAIPHGAVFWFKCIHGDTHGEWPGVSQL